MKLEKNISTNQIWIQLFGDNTPTIDAILHIPKLWFFIPSPLQGDIDVHTLGGQKGTYEGLWHAIPSRDCAYGAAVNKIHPSPMPCDNTFALLMKREYEIGTTYSVGLPMNGYVSQVQCCVGYHHDTFPENKRSVFEI